jgi:hypothetical protein
MLFFVQVFSSLVGLYGDEALGGDSNVDLL